VILSGYQYPDSSCDQSHAVDFDLFLPVGCLNGTTFTCSDNPPALVQDWPAIGVYSEDRCDHPLLVAAFSPDCSDWSDLYGTGGTSTLTSCDDDLFEFDLFNNTATCQAGAGEGELWAHYELPTQQCFAITSPSLSTTASAMMTAVGGVSAVISRIAPGLSGVLDSSSGPSSSLFVPLADVTDGPWYAYSTCSGANSLPGVKTSSNDDDSAAYGGLTTGGFYSLVIIGSLLFLCLIIGCLYFTQQTKEKKNKSSTSGGSLKEKLSRREEEEMVPL
jgi:hypothetical protein